MTRSKSYYWKCDVPDSLLPSLPSEFGRSASDWTSCVADIARETFGADFLRVESNASPNRHITCLIHCRDATHFFRADTSGVADDYMLAETHLMSLLRRRGLPVPQILATDVSRARFPLHYQIVERVPYTPLHKLDQSQHLDRQAIGRQLGECMAQIHQVQAPGYGFLDTSALRNGNEIRGLDVAYTQYFTRRLDDHFAELTASGLLPASEIDSIRELLERHLPLTQLSQGCVVHRDLAFWNLLGTPSRIHAIIDWEDAVLGDPADDLGIFNCFYDEVTMQALLEGYARHVSPSSEFYARVWLHTLRNMLWKTVLRHRLNYFDGKAPFLRSRENDASLKAFTLDRIRSAVRYLSEERT